MTQLSVIARNAPKIFYALGVLWIAQAILVPLMELSATGYSTQVPDAGGIVKFAYYRLVERALYDGLFLIGIGLNAEILLAILRRQEPANA